MDSTQAQSRQNPSRLEVFSQAIPPRLLGVIWERTGALGVAGEHRLTVEFSGRGIARPVP
jgi:hypothetical protein